MMPLCMHRMCNPVGSAFDLKSFAQGSILLENIFYFLLFFFSLKLFIASAVDAEEMRVEVCPIGPQQ